MKKLICLSFLMLTCLTAQLCFASDEVRSQHLKVAVLKNFPPQYLMSEGGKPGGFAIDVIEEIAKLANLEIEYLLKDNWSEVFEAVKSGQADIIPNQGITERRKQWFSFSHPVETFPVSIFTRKNEDEISSVSSLAGKKTAVIRLNIGEVLLRDEPNIIIRKYSHIEDALFNLLSGNADALIFPEPVLWKLAKQAGIEDKIKVVGPPLLEIRRAISLAKGNTALLEKINAAVKEFVGSDEYQKIYIRWYGKPEPYWTAKKVAGIMGAALVAVILLMGFWRYRSTLLLNRELTEQIEKRVLAENQLKKAYDTIELKVAERTHYLQEALSHIKTLNGLLPICAQCKKIRDDKGYWNQVEAYIEKHSDVKFSHGLCEECSDKLYGDEEWYKDLKKQGGLKKIN